MYLSITAVAREKRYSAHLWRKPGFFALKDCILNQYRHVLPHENWVRFTNKTVKMILDMIVKHFVEAIRK